MIECGKQTGSLFGVQKTDSGVATTIVRVHAHSGTDGEGRHAESAQTSNNNGKHTREMRRSPSYMHAGSAKDSAQVRYPQLMLFVPLLQRFVLRFGSAVCLHRDSRRGLLPCQSVDVDGGRTARRRTARSSGGGRRARDGDDSAAIGGAIGPAADHRRSSARADGDPAPAPTVVTTNLSVAADPLPGEASAVRSNDDRRISSCTKAWKMSVAASAGDRGAEGAVPPRGILSRSVRPGTGTQCSE
jgi:hypothetical protein